MYTKDRDSAGADEKVMNEANWRIRRWQIGRVLLYWYWLKAANTDIAIRKYPIGQTPFFPEEKLQLLWR